MNQEATMPDKILVLDKDPDVRVFVSDILKKEGFVVSAAESGSAGFQVLQDPALGLVVAGVNTTALGGDFMATIKRGGSGADIIVMAEPKDEPVVIQCLHNGAYDYVPKPLTRSDFLLAAVRRVFEKRRLVAANQRLVKQLEGCAVTDPLTGVLNHRQLYNCILDEVVRATRYHHSFLIIIAEIDHFKGLTDNFGCLFGELVLKQMARLLEDNLRLTDRIFRCEDGRFTLLLPETDRHQVVRIAERILDNTRYHDFSSNGHRAQITLSMGAAEFPNEAHEASVLIEMAENRVAQARAAGRDCFFFEVLTAER